MRVLIEFFQSLFAKKKPEKQEKPAISLEMRKDPVFLSILDKVNPGFAICSAEITERTTVPLGAARKIITLHIIHKETKRTEIRRLNYKKIERELKKEARG